MPDLVYLTEKSPLVGRVARWLADLAAGNPPDLSDVAVVVPTSGAARRLKDELLAASRGGGLFPPLLASPMALPALAATVPLARPGDSLLAWSAVLRSVDRTEFPAVFEGFGPEMHPQIFLRIAKSLADLTALLAESGLDPSSPEVQKACEEDEERWRQIGALHRLYRGRLRRAGLIDHNDAIRDVALRGERLPGIRHVAVAGVPDLNRILQIYLTRLEEAGVRVSILVDAPGCDGLLFDAWGRPDVEAWSGICLPLRNEAISALADPFSESLTAAHLITSQPGAALCAADPDSAVAIRSTFENHGIAVYDPQGTPLSRFEGAVVSRRWIAFCRTRRLADLRLLGECPHFLSLLSKETKTPPSALLAILDVFVSKHLFELLDDAAKYFEEFGDGFDSEASVIRAVIAMRRKFDAGSSLEKLPAFLRALYGGKKIATVSLEAESLDLLAASLQSVLDTPVGESSLAADLLDIEWERERVYGTHAPGAVELHGWLEAHWLSEPSLVLCGFIEGAVPSHVSGHAFLPESARVALGLKGNEERYVRDLYLLRCILAVREDVSITFSKTGPGGDPSKPSRLLFRCPDTELPQRVRALFGDAPSYRGGATRERAWKLDLPRVEPPKMLRVTAFGMYLACPLRFYLKHRLKMEAYDAEKAEMDPRDFGTVLHKIVEDFSIHPEMRESRNAGAIEKFLVDDLDDVLLKQYGHALSVPLRVQRESLRARLRAFAGIQARERRDGWRIQAAEFRFESEDSIHLGGLPVTASIDRLEIHEGTRQLRILDYKTFSNAMSPQETHIAKAVGLSPVAEADFQRAGKPARWVDLQLPLYRALAESRWPDIPAPPEVGYILLPERIEDSEISMLPLPQEDFAAALRCATAVADRIRRGVYWPPGEVEWDDFEQMFLGNPPEEAVSEASIEFLKGVPA